VYSDLDRIMKQCLFPGWDGNQAKVVSEATYTHARDFLNALPLGIEPPSVGAEPDGCLTFEWSRSPRRAISISISESNVLDYAALIGIRKAFGSEPFYRALPQSIYTLISEVIDR
jgi:hypothetical protein